MKPVLGWLILLNFFGATAGLMALDPGKSLTQYSVRVWNIEAGLPGNSIYAICQTRDGYLWIGTQDGLARFDGVRFEVFTNENTPQLKSNVIRALHQDEGGTLWIGTTSGGLTGYKNGIFSHYSMDRHKGLHHIIAISQDKWGNIWIGSSTNGLTRFNGEDFYTYTAGNGLSDSHVRNIHKDREGDLWITTGGGVVKIERPGEFNVFGSRARFPYYKTFSVYDASRQWLWIGTGGNYLYRLTRSEIVRYDSGAGIPHQTVTHLYSDRAETLWIGTDGGGLTRMLNGKAETLSKTDGLACGFVYSIFEDPEGNLWVGTLDGGLHQLRDSRFTTYTRREGLSDEYIYTISQGRDDELWIGTREGLNRLKNGKVTTVLTARDGLLNDAVLSLFYEPGGTLWIGTGGGLHRYRDGRLRTLTSKDGLSGNHIRCIWTAGGNTGDTWIGTDTGLNRISHRTGKIRIFNNQTFVPSNYIRFLFRDSRSRIWVCTDKGVSVIKNGTPRPYHFDADFKQMHRSIFHCVYEDKKRVLWFGTEDGLLRSQGDKHFLYTVRHGLTDNLVNSVMEDRKGFLWLGGRSGISRVNKKDLEDLVLAADGNTGIKKVDPDWYNESDGMKSRWCTGPGFQTADGRFWYPTSDGVTVIDPQAIEKDTRPLPVIIEKLVVDGAAINTDTAAPDRNGETLRLGPGKKRLEFYYTGLCFSDPKKVKFKIRLLGFDNDWVSMNQVRSTTYTGLEPGEYTFQVIASNTDGVWNLRPKSFSFYINPYFYQTVWFYIAVILIIAFLIFWGHYFRVRNLEKKAKELARLVDERTRDLEERNVQLQKTHSELRRSHEVIEHNNRQLEEQSEQLKDLDRAKSRFFANISHEFRTPLTLIMGPLEQILADNPPKKLGGSAAMMLRNSRRLLNLVNQLLELAKFESGKIRLDARLSDMAIYVKNLVSGFQPMATQKGVSLQFLRGDSCVPVYFDPDKLEKIVSNLLSNAFNYTPVGGRISVTVEPVMTRSVRNRFPSGCMQLSVRDTGTGIPPGQLPHVFDRFYHGKQTHDYQIKGAGIGLSLTKDLVSLHHGEIEVRSSTEGVDRGTCFLIRFPIGDISLENPGSSKNGEPPEDYSSTDFNDLPDENGEEVPGEDPIEIGRNDEAPVALVVEDNKDMRVHIKEALQPRFRVIEAVDGKEGLLCAKDIIPDIVVSDVAMPIMDGFNMCRELKNEILTSHIPVILLTARTLDKDMREGLECGADDYITKPFNVRVLTARALNLIDLRKQLKLEHKNRSAMLPDKIRYSALDDDFYKKLLETIDANMEEPEFNIEEMAKEMGMSQSSLYRKVHALSGQSAVKFLRSYRVKRAAQLFDAGAGTVSEVSAKVGFLDKSHFAQSFRKQFNCSPSEYIKSGAAAPGLPVPDEPESSPAHAPEDKIHALEPGKPIALVVEDDMDARTYIRQSLENDFRVIEASDGAEGIQRAVEIVPDLVVSDIIMPNTDGFQLTQTLKNDILTSHIPIILLTSRASTNSMVKGLEALADDYITKPFNAEILRIRCRNLIRLRAHLQKKRLREMTFLPVEIARNNAEKEFVYELNTAIARHISDPNFNTEQLAKALLVSPSTLKRKTRAITGETPSEYLRSRRLLRGAELLRENFGSVTEVAFEVGFKNLSHFTRSFKEKFHQLPSVYMALE